MNLSTEQKQTHRQGKETCGREDTGGEGWMGSVRLWMPTVTFRMDNK